MQQSATKGNDAFKRVVFNDEDKQAASERQRLFKPLGLPALSRIDTRTGRVIYNKDAYSQGDDGHDTEYILDLCCGTAKSATLFHLRRNPRAKVIGVDRDKDEAWVRSHLPKSVQHRFTFISRDVVELDKTEMERVIAEAWPGVGLKDVTHAHSSPPCQTMSRADRGFTGYRDNWGRPRHPKAFADDRALEVTLQLFKHLSRINPNCLITVENPWNTVFPHLPPVQDLLFSRKWDLHLTSYCMCADETDGHPWPQKDSLFLTFGLPLNLKLPRCEYDCGHLVPGTFKHKAALCRNRHNHPDQVVITDPMDKGEIPTGLFRRLFAAHRRYLQGSTVDARVAVRNQAYGSSAGGEQNDTSDSDDESEDDSDGVGLSDLQDSTSSSDLDIDADADASDSDDDEHAQPDPDAPTDDESDDDKRVRESYKDIPDYPVKDSPIKPHARHYPALRPDAPRWDLRGLQPWSLVFVDEISFDFKVKGKRQHALMAYDLITGGVRVKLVKRKKELGDALDRIITNESLDKRNYKVTFVSDNCGGMNLVRDTAMKRKCDWLPVPPYQPHLNVIEGYVRHFKEDVAAVMLGAMKEDGLIDEGFIVHAIEYVAYTSERFVRKRKIPGAVNGSPFELNTGVKPRGDRLVPFGAPGWAFIPEELRASRGTGKHLRMEPVLMLGYSHMYTRCYKLLTAQGTIIRREQVEWLLDKPLGIMPQAPESDAPMVPLSDKARDKLFDIDEINDDSDHIHQQDRDQSTNQDDQASRTHVDVIALTKKVYDSAGNPVPKQYIYDRLIGVEGRTPEQAKRMRFPDSKGEPRLYAKDFKYDLNTKWIKLVSVPRSASQFLCSVAGIALPRSHPELQQERVDYSTSGEYSYDPSDPWGWCNIAQKDMDWKKALAGPDKDAVLKSYEKEIASLKSTVLKELKEGDSDWCRALREATNSRVLLDFKRSGVYKSRCVIQGFRENKTKLDGDDFNYSSNVSGMSTVRHLFLKPAGDHPATPVATDANATRRGRGKGQEQCFLAPKSTPDGCRAVAQLDVSTAFLQSDLFPAGSPKRFLKFKCPVTGNIRYFLQLGVVYGSCSAPVRWMNTLHPWIVSTGFVQGKNEPCVFYHKDLDVTVSTFVDDCGIEGPLSGVLAFVRMISKRFDCKDPEWLTVDGGQLDHLGMVFFRDVYATYLSMENYIDATMMRLDLENEDCSKYKLPINNQITDFSAVTEEESAFCKTACGCLGWLAGTGRPDVKLSHSRISQHMASPNQGMLKAVRHALLYCMNTKTLCLHQPHKSDGTWRFFSDSDHAGNSEIQNNRRSQLAFVAMQGSAPISWGSKASAVKFDHSEGSSPASGKPFVHGMPVCHPQCTDIHPDVSSAAAEIYAASIALNECLHLSYVVEEMGNPLKLPLNIEVDNTTAIAFSKDRINRSKLKHIDVRQAWVEALRDDSLCKLIKVDTKDNFADLGTKILDITTFERLRDQMMVTKPAPRASPAA